MGGFVEMTVAELIEELQKEDPSMEVRAWDGDYQHPIPIIKVHSENDWVWLETEA
jgi:ribosomal protein S12 methylthiotransferase accessory factor YcaO